MHGQNHIKSCIAVNTNYHAHEENNYIRAQICHVMEKHMTFQARYDPRT